MDHGACSDEEMAAFLSGELSDERMVAGITMAGTINRSYHADDGHLSVRGPVLLMSGSNDPGHAVSESFDTLSGIERTLLDTRCLSWFVQCGTMRHPRRGPLPCCADLCVGLWAQTCIGRRRCNGRWNLDGSIPVDRLRASQSRLKPRENGDGSFIRSGLDDCTLGGRGLLFDGCRWLFRLGCIVRATVVHHAAQGPTHLCSRTP